MSPIKLGAAGFFGIMILILIFGGYEGVDDGTVKVGKRFGKVVTTLNPGPNWSPLNIVTNFTEIQCYDRTNKQTVGMPSQDRLITTFDFSIQYEVNPSLAQHIVTEHGDEDPVEKLISVHLLPNFRSLSREVGKGTDRAELFFEDKVQAAMQTDLTARLADSIGSEGIIVNSVLIRDVRLPKFVNDAIEAKKKREEQVNEQMAELERKKLELAEITEKAVAERKAASEQAAAIREIADARAYEIEKLQEAADKAANSSDAYLQIRGFEALESMAANPASQVYFLGEGGIGDLVTRMLAPAGR
jgi:regulator of protease activity HflC (stomatin/prohibitin superfamily)